MTETNVHFACANCGKQYSCPNAYAGRKTKCGKCGEQVTVPRESTHADPLSELVGFACGLCGTRMNVPPRYVGRRVKCPDCDHLTVVPKPAPKRAKQRPAAMQGEQYEVYEGEEQPRGVDLARASPKSVGFECRICQTHLVAPESEVGGKVSCPDCGVETTVPVPKRPVARHALVEDHYEVDAASEEPPLAAQGLFDHYVKTTPAGYRDLAKRVEQGVKQSGRPDPKGVPLIADLLGWVHSKSIVSVLLALSIGIGVTVGSFALAAAMFAGGGPFGVLSGVSLLGLGVIAGCLTFGGIAAYGLATIDQSSEGAPHVEEWPTTIPTEWTGALIQLAVALVAAASLGGAIAAGLRLPADQATISVIASLWLILPWILLSQLDVGSVFGVFSPRLVRTLRYAPLSWAIYYAEIALGVIGFCAIAAELASLSPAALILLTPLAAIAVLQYAWLLGRLAWVIGAATPDGADEDDPT